jgi:acetoin utilization deacetylase AcuC-like enzyme
MRTAIVVDPRYRAHDTGEGHPERPERLLSVERTLHDWRGAPLEQVPARLADEDEIRLAHSADLYAKIARTQHATRSHIDADTATCDRSFETALLAAGGLLELGDAVATGAYRNGFAFVRPPGHHATSGQAMGFCLFNNVAIAARHLQRKHGYRRIAIIDWDLHHGNGTEAIFYDDPSVLYVSLHQYPFYPGTGAVTDTGRGDGLGFNVNVPFSAGVGDEGYALALEEIIAPVLRQFAPEFLLVSAGFDCHWRDPLPAAGRGGRRRRASRRGARRRLRPRRHPRVDGGRARRAHARGARSRARIAPHSGVRPTARGARPALAPLTPAARFALAGVCRTLRLRLASRRCSASACPSWR